MLEIRPRYVEPGEIAARVFLLRDGQLELWQDGLRPDAKSRSFRLYITPDHSGFTAEQELLILVGRPTALPDLAALCAGAAPAASPDQRLWERHTLRVRRQL